MLKAILTGSTFGAGLAIFGLVAAIQMNPKMFTTKHTIHNVVLESLPAESPTHVMLAEMTIAGKIHKDVGVAKVKGPAKKKQCTLEYRVLDEDSKTFNGVFVKDCYERTRTDE